MKLLDIILHICYILLIDLRIIKQHIGRIVDLFRCKLLHDGIKGFSLTNISCSIVFGAVYQKVSVLSASLKIPQICSFSVSRLHLSKVGIPMSH